MSKREVEGNFSFLYQKINGWIPVGALSDAVEQLSGLQGRGANSL